MSSSVILADAVLKSLAGMLDGNETFADDDTTTVRNGRQRRKSKASRVVPSVDDKPFKDYGAPIPASRDEATALAESLLTGQRTALQVSIGIAVYRLELTGQQCRTCSP